MWITFVTVSVKTWLFCKCILIEKTSWWCATYKNLTLCKYLHNCKIRLAQACGILAVVTFLLCSEMNTWWMAFIYPCLCQCFHPHNWLFSPLTSTFPTAINAKWIKKELGPLRSAHLPLEILYLTLVWCTVVNKLFFCSYTCR